MAVTILTMDNFQQEVLDASQKVLIDFYASWCGPCQAMAPLFEEASNEATNVKFCKVNVDEQPKLARSFGISSIPTLIVFENGKPVQQSVGGRTKEGLLELVR